MSINYFLEILYKAFVNSTNDGHWFIKCVHPATCVKGRNLYAWGHCPSIFVVINLSFKSISKIMRMRPCAMKDDGWLWTASSVRRTLSRLQCAVKSEPSVTWPIYFPRFIVQLFFFYYAKRTRTLSSRTSAPRARELLQVIEFIK